MQQSARNAGANLTKQPSTDEINIQPEILPPLTTTIIDELACRIQYTIKTATDATPGKAASDVLKALVAKRVPPKTLARYDTLDNHHFIVWDEALSILERIFAYPAVVQYRKHLSGAPKEVRLAWQIHSHSLRCGELYIVQDRTKAFLGYLHAVAAECGIVGSDERKTFERRFKARFKRRLLERHELTHAHARPSLTSRIINAHTTMARVKPDEVEAMVIESLNSTKPLLDKLQALRGKALMFDDALRLHEESAQREAREMLDLFGKAALATLNITLPQPASDAQPERDKKVE